MTKDATCDPANLQSSAGWIRIRIAQFGANELLEVQKHMSTVSSAFGAVQPALQEINEAIKLFDKGNKGFFPLYIACSAWQLS
jgi:hypothetical protein